jgi:hypothetical protein
MHCSDSFGITATIVFMMALNGLPEPAAAWRRTIATLIGGPCHPRRAGCEIVPVGRNEERLTAVSKGEPCRQESRIAAGSWFASC